MTPVEYQLIIETKDKEIEGLRQRIAELESIAANLARLASTAEFREAPSFVYNDRGFWTD